MSIKFKPTKGRILVEAVHAKPHVGNVIVPEAAREQKPAEAVVVAFGPLCELPIRIGDRVLTQRYNGTEVRIANRSYRLLDPEDVIALVEDAA